MSTTDHVDPREVVPAELGPYTRQDGPTGDGLDPGSDAVVWDLRPDTVITLNDGDHDGQGSQRALTLVLDTSADFRRFRVTAGQVEALGQMLIGLAARHRAKTRLFPAASEAAGLIGTTPTNHA